MTGRTYEKYELIKRVLAHGRFVLHGANLDDLRWLEPKPPLWHGRGRGPTGVYATEDVACALFFAVVDRRRVRWCTASGGQFYVELAEGETAPWTHGAVYVLDRVDFDEVDGNLVSPAAVKAVGKVAVGAEDFPLPDRVHYLTRGEWLAGHGR